MKPSPEQEKIIESDNSIVVIAQPGSGKTFTLANKIRIILDKTPHYKGVIAISYTNKASKELEKRSLHGGIDKKNSFFGTMDKFYISEIILPFGRQLFGKPSKDIEIIEFKSSILGHEIDYLYDIPIEDIMNNHIDIIKRIFIKGYVILETVPLLSLHILQNTKSCVNYLQARFSHIIIDEYQDCGLEQHEVFVGLKNIGLKAIAVGDENQSIYGFSNKSSEYLIRLASDDTFETHRLTKNHRCHPSIINYSMSLISRDFTDFLPSDEHRVFSISLNGKEDYIAKWLNETIYKAKEKYRVEKNSEVGILTRNTRTGSIIDQNLTIKHKFYESTPFDNDSSLWGRLFSDILRFIFDKNNTKYELIEEYLDIELQSEKANTIMKKLTLLESIKVESKLLQQINIFLEIAEIIYPNAKNQNAINILGIVLKDKKLLNTFKPAGDDEVQIMTLHKSKGLEFKIVFHLDLYEYIFPSKRIINGEFVFTEKEQDINLHYVGITRAKECCILCTSNLRTNGNNEIKRGSSSEFLQIPRLTKLRSHFSI
ncbi:ATP-dependent helicase [Paenibacillus sp. GYB004]|uniref:ATP-dependent helicase n=1 Tax=Paenibacillus sp. GYB004 TaxID=2994393 RepID=UPI002F9627D5